MAATERVPDIVIMATIESFGETRRKPSHEALRYEHFSSALVQRNACRLFSHVVVISLLPVRKSPDSSLSPHVRVNAIVAYLRSLPYLHPFVLTDPTLRLPDIVLGGQAMSAKRILEVFVVWSKNGMIFTRLVATT